ncbi:MAG: hypothetical protein AAFX55_11815 [Bacteroidota bacterium]
MANCDIDIATHKKPGTKQSGRMLKALQPGFIHLDERTIADLIVGTNKLSQQINFYDNNNVLTDRWDTFFQWETTAILAQITQLDILALIQDFKLKKRELLFVPALADQREIVLPFFQAISKTVIELTDKIAELPNDFEIKAYFKNTQNNLMLLIDTVQQELTLSTDLLFTLQHHLFNKKVQNIFGLLQQWKNKSQDQLTKNLDTYPKHSPQYALYLAFLKLFGFAQDNLNEFTERHLDFYYNKILNLYPEAANPDAVHLCIEPHKNASAFLIEKGSVFLAGKDSEGRNKYYESASDTAINQAKIAQIYGSSIRDKAYYFQDVTDLNAAGDSWKAFPGEAVYNDIGFALASPMLYLRGGERNITLTFWNNENQKVKIHPTNFEFYLTGEEGWLKADANFNNDITTLTIRSDEKGTIPFNTEVHEGVFINTPFPVLKIISKTGDNESFNKVDLGIEVTNYKQFKLFNNTGEVDHTKSFEPYGALPKNGNALIFACKEFFQKEGAQGTFNITTDAPVNLVRGVVQKRVRNINTPDILNIVTDVPTYVRFNMEGFSNFTLLNNGIWIDGNLNSGYTFTNTSLIPYDFAEDEAITPSDASGFAKFVLDDEAYSNNTFLNNYIEEAKKTEGATALPYVPNILEMSFNYSVSASFSVSETQNTYGLYQIYPKGYKVFSTERMRILPPYTNEGELFIGIKDIQDGNALNLLFQVADGTANPRQEAIDLTWSYLYGTEWVYFESNAINDATNGLTQSGIVTLNSPNDLKLKDQTEWPSDYWWIRIQAPERIDAICDLIGIHDQALKATLVDFESKGTDFIEHTDARTISKLQSTNRNIKKIEQPYSSFSGRPREDQNRFYQRTSERLRHKGKAITIWDYEKLVLDNFPEVFQVKCLNHHRYDSAELDNSSAGYVTLIPVAKTKASNNPLVDLGIMKRIETFIKNRTSPHVRLAVKAPRLEKLKLRFSVKYIEIPGADTNLYKQQLQDTINAFLSPWAYSDDGSIDFQKPINKSSLIHLIEQQTYVDYISDFKVDHFILEESSDGIVPEMKDIDKIIPKTVYSLFVPDTHDITPLTQCCS